MHPKRMLREFAQDAFCINAANARISRTASACNRTRARIRRFPQRALNSPPRNIEMDADCQHDDNRGEADSQDVGKDVLQQAHGRLQQGRKAGRIVECGVPETDGPRCLMHGAFPLSRPAAGTLRQAAFPSAIRYERHRDARTLVTDGTPAEGSGLWLVEKNLADQVTSTHSSERPRRTIWFRRTGSCARRILGKRSSRALKVTFPSNTASDAPRQ